MRNSTDKLAVSLGFLLRTSSLSPMYLVEAKGAVTRCRSENTELQDDLPIPSGHRTENCAGPATVSTMIAFDSPGP